MRIKKRHQEPYGAERCANKETTLYIYDRFLLFFEKTGVQKEKEKISE